MRTLFIALSITALTLVGFVSTASAETPVSHSDTGLTLVLPDGWGGSGGDVVRVKNNDETAFIYFWGVDATDPESVAKHIEAELGSFLEAVKKKGKGEEAKAGPFTAWSTHGTAKVGDFKVVWRAVVVKGNKDRVGILLGFADKDTWKASEADFEKILGSFADSGE